MDRSKSRRICKISFAVVVVLTIVLIGAFTVSQEIELQEKIAQTGCDIQYKLPAAFLVPAMLCLLVYTLYLETAVYVCVQYVLTDKAYKTAGKTVFYILLLLSALLPVIYGACRLLEMPYIK